MIFWHDQFHVLLCIFRVLALRKGNPFQENKFHVQILTSRSPWFLPTLELRKIHCIQPFVFCWEDDDNQPWRESAEKESSNKQPEVIFLGSQGTKKRKQVHLPYVEVTRPKHCSQPALSFPHHTPLTTHPSEARQQVAELRPPFPASLAFSTWANLPSSVLLSFQPQVSSYCRWEATWPELSPSHIKKSTSFSFSSLELSYLP